MLPISELHFAFCGIATVAATLGYACARRTVLSLTPPNKSSRADVEAGPPEERSLKRKLSDSDEEDVDPEEQSRPMKRNRTPPTDQQASDKDEWEVIVAPPPYEQAVDLHQPEELVQDSGTPSQEDPHSTEHSVAARGEPTPSAQPATSSPPEEKGAEEAGRCSTPQPPQINLPSDEHETLIPHPITHPKPVAPTNIESAKAFSAFSGSGSPFASYSNASGASPFAISGQVVKAAPAWRRDNKSESHVFGLTSSTNALAPSPNGSALAPTTTSPALSQSESSLGLPGEMQSLTKSSGYLTGEEDEDVEAELKGVKLFVKCGPKEFTDGMYGHVKILAQKVTPSKTGNGDLLRTEAETNSSSRSRLLFRRDPLGQVSMNVGLHPSIRCHFDPAENILRVITMELAATDGKDSKEDIVIYALKPGRTPKADFRLFAKTLCDHDGLKSRVATSLAAPAGGDVAAS